MAKKPPQATTQKKSNATTGGVVAKKKGSPKKTIPVTLLSGFLGSGKTSLLRHVLMNREGLRVAVILNEISEINIDVLALKGAKLLHTEEKVVEMSNGCICCTLREDLLKTLREMYQKQEFDAVLIESSGIAEPMQTAETFFIDLGDGGAPLQEQAPLDNCVTVVDASTLKFHLNDPRAAMAIDPKAKDEKEDQSVGELLIQQIEFANVVVLNKIDRLTGEKSLDLAVQKPEVSELVSLVRSINPSAVIVPAVHSVVPLREILATKRFSEEWAKGVVGWMDDIVSGVKHNPETLEFGIGSYLYTANRPFHPQRLHEWMDAMFFWNELAIEEIEEPEEDEEEEGDEEETVEKSAHHSKPASPPTSSHHVDTDIAPIGPDGFQQFGAEEKERRDAAYGNFFRSKGFIWLGNPDRLDHVVEWSQAGTVLTFQYGCPWTDFTTQIKGQRLVFIGQNLNKQKLKADLDALLLTQEEFDDLLTGKYNGAPFPDPFEPFPSSALLAAQHDHDHDHDHEQCSLHHHGHGHDDAVHHPEEDKKKDKKKENKKRPRE